MTAADGQYETIARGCFYGHAGSKTMVARDLNRWLERDKHLAQASPDAGTRPIRTICSGVE